MVMMMMNMREERLSVTQWSGVMAMFVLEA